MVIVIFHGKSDSNNGIDIVEITEEAGCIRVRYRPSWYQVAFVRTRLANQDEDSKSASTHTKRKDASADKERSVASAEGEGSLDTTSFAFVVLPASKKAVVLEEDVRSLIEGPAVWKERAKLGPVANK